MTVTSTPPRLRTAEPSWLVPLVTGALCLAGVIGLYGFFVRTETGQQWDVLAYRGATASWELIGSALTVLQVVSNGLVALVIVVVLGIAVARRQLFLGLEAAAVVVGANVTTQVMKYGLFIRPDLVDTGAMSAANSLPSGHTTVAASAVVAGLLVVPVALRPVTSLAGTAVAVGFGWATLIGRWHRPSDVMAGVLVAVGWGFAALFTARFRHRIWGRHYSARSHAPVSPVVWVLLVGAVLAGLGAAVAFIDTLGVPAAQASGRQQLVAYLGGSAAVLSVTGAAMAAFLAQLTPEGAWRRGSEPGPQTP